MEEEPQLQVEVQVEVEVPCYFLCPISLAIMRDPVTLPTGITYDRDGIESWLLTAATCPLTNQPVPADCDPTPNHTMRRLIQSWCALHAADGVDRVHTPKPRADRAAVATLVSRVHAAATTGSSAPQPQQQLLAALRELRDVAAESDRNRKLVAVVPGAVDVLAAVFAASANAKSEGTAAAVRDEALEVISSLQVPEQCLRRVAETNDALVSALVSALQRSSAASRARAALLLERVTAALPPSRLVSLPEQAFREAVELLRDRPAVSRSATKAALHVLMRTLAWGRNRVKAVDAGAVPVLVDMLFDDGAERRACELVLAALERLCGCAEGRADLVAHAAGVAAVGRKALRVSEVATDKAVRVLRSVARHAATAAVVQEMAQAGVVATLCLVAQSEQYAERTRERARETLRLHARAWRTSPCLHHHLQAVYPC
ncbi:E3 ubiquitin-protein ligase PUB23-like [Miscanthus floridulus]|uniref:E3 ubiquitin-protein ligase PUB23-like n=1 Tax=Miscanthus floridulus TaxID=154761 RepID=UPI003458CE3D